MKKALYAIIILLAAIAAIGLLAPKEYATEREIEIRRPNAEVFEYLKSLKAQNEWSTWGKMDPQMTTTFQGTDGTVGFVSAWEGNKEVGKGEQEITGIVEGQRIDYELRFIEPWESVSLAWITTEALAEDLTRVRWGFSGRMEFPMNIMLLFMNLENDIGKDFDQGLQNLKAILE